MRDQRHRGRRGDRTLSAEAIGGAVLPARRWLVLLLGGASGAGKTEVSYRLARHFGVGITEIDDFHVLLERMTTPQQQPAIHYWRTHPGADALPPEVILEYLIDVCRALAPGLEAVIASHLEMETPIVLEGDYLLPSFAAQERFDSQVNSGRVRALFLDEADEQQLRANFLRREPERGIQAKRARVSWLHGRWLKQEAERCGLPVVPARPWDTVIERAIAAIS